MEKYAQIAGTWYFDFIYYDFLGLPCRGMVKFRRRVYLAGWDFLITDGCGNFLVPSQASLSWFFKCFRKNVPV